MIHGRRVATPNDPKLSDGRGWRGPCMAGGKAAAEAGAVTAALVRCSAWLGVAVIGHNMGMSLPSVLYPSWPHAKSFRP